MRLVAPSEWVSGPWRNGGGITHEVAREGPADAFLWRVSVADVARAGPFSLFPGVDRVIGLLEGDGFTLSGASGEATLRHPGDLFAFPGDEAFTCALLGGPVRDLNVMVDRSRLGVGGRLARFDPGAATVAADGAVLLLFVVEGRTEVVGLGRADRHALVVSDEDVRLRAAEPLDLVIARLAPRRTQ